LVKSIPKNTPARISKIAECPSALSWASGISSQTKTVPKKAGLIE